MTAYGLTMWQVLTLGLIAYLLLWWGLYSWRTVATAIGVVLLFLVAFIGAYNLISDVHDNMRGRH